MQDLFLIDQLEVPEVVAAATLPHNGVLSMASAGHEHPAGATFSTQLCGISAAATTSGTSRGWMRKRSCTVAQQGGVILSCPGWMDANGDSTGPWWCMWCGHD